MHDEEDVVPRVFGLRIVARLDVESNRNQVLVATCATYQ